jgi:hypothetical protein
MSFYIFCIFPLPTAVTSRILLYGVENAMRVIWASCCEPPYFSLLYADDRINILILIILSDSDLHIGTKCSVDKA